MTDQPVNDFELVSFLLEGLGSEYDPFVTFVTTCVEPISLKDLYSHILTHKLHLSMANANVNNKFALLTLATMGTHNPFLEIMALTTPTTIEALEACQILAPQISLPSL